MLDNSFQIRYDKLPIATYAISEPPLNTSMPFMLPHHHSEFEVIAVVCGQCEVTIDQAHYTAGAGDLLFIPPYSLHSGHILPGKLFSHFCFCFDLTLLKEDGLCKQIETGYLDVVRVVRHSAPGAAALFGAAQCIYHQCEGHPRGWDLVVRGQLLFLVGLLEQYEYFFSAIRKDARCDFSARVFDLLNHTYAADLTSRDIAAQMSYSQSYFCRLFRENFSASFQQYLCQFRLCKAKLLLTQENLTVGQTAARVGFNSSSYFSRQFRLLYGCTPKQFQTAKALSNKFSEYYLGSSVSVRSQ